MRDSIWPLKKNYNHMKDLANLRRLQIKNDQLSTLLGKRKVMKSKSLIYLGLIVPVLMFVLEFSLLRFTGIRSNDSNTGNEINSMQCIAVDFSTA